MMRGPANSYKLISELTYNVHVYLFNINIIKRFGSNQTLSNQKYFVSVRLCSIMKLRGPANFIPFQYQHGVADIPFLMVMHEER